MEYDEQERNRDALKSLMEIIVKIKFRRCKMRREV
jgi:hypothetical protein